MDHELLCHQWLHLSQKLEEYSAKWDEKKWNKFPIKYLSHSYFWFIVCLIQQRCFQEPWGPSVENAARGATQLSTSFSATIPLSCPFPCSHQWLPSPHLSSTLFSAFCASLPSISSASFASSVFFISMFPPTILDPWLIRFSQIFSAVLPSVLVNCVNKALRSLLVPDTAPSDCVSGSLCLVVFCGTIFCFKFFFHCPLLATSLASTLFWCFKFFMPFTRTRFCFNLQQAMQA